MGRKYTFRDQDTIYFVTFTVVHWIDVYIRQIYRDTFYESINFCQREKGLEVYAYCVIGSVSVAAGNITWAVPQMAPK